MNYWLYAYQAYTLTNWVISFYKNINYCIPPHQYTVTNKNNHTTSTKCQYHAAASNPKWWVLVKWLYTILKKEINIKIVPIKTWNPWNPVVIKKQDPKTLSEIVKGESKYSNACKLVNKVARIKVIIKANKACFLARTIIAWWAQVTVAPELNKKKSVC